MDARLNLLEVHQSCEEAKSIKRGDFVKLAFADIMNEHPTERMWVLVEDIYIDGTFRGKLANDPVELYVFIMCGEDVLFKSGNILNIKRGR
jgi:uncharacterized protein YegJ (DUF2314 family)